MKGHIALLAANIMWGLLAPVSKAFMNLGVVSAWALSGIRIICGALLFWALSYMVPASFEARQDVDRKDLLKLFFASLFVIAGNQVLIILGLMYANPVDASVICSMTPIFVIVLAFIIYRQKVSWLKILGVTLGFAGVMLFVFTGEKNISVGVTNPLLGDMLCVAAQTCGALYLIMFSDIIQKYSPMTLMKWMFLFSAIIMIPLTGFDIVTVEWGRLPMEGWLELVYIVLFATCLAYFLLPIGQNVVKPTVVAMYNYLQPVTAAVCSIAVGLAVVTGQMLLATVFVLLGVWIVSRPAKA